MKQPDSNWDKLINLPNEYPEINPEIVKNATNIINVKFKNKKQRVKSPYIIAVAAVFLAVAVFLMVFYLTPKKSEDFFFDIRALEFQEINDIEEFKTENNLSFSGFDQDFSTYTAYTVIESKQLAYVKQETVIVSDNGFDSVSLYIPLIPNASFDFSKSFNDLNEVRTIENVTVKYKFYEGDNFYCFNSTFTVDKYSYFIEIETQNSQVEPLFNYLDTFIK